jgi:hypothetical protein
MAKSFKPLKVATTCTNESVLKNTAVFFNVPAGQRVYRAIESSTVTFFLVKSLFLYTMFPFKFVYWWAGEAHTRLSLAKLAAKVFRPLQVAISGYCVPFGFFWNTEIH